MYFVHMYYWIQKSWTYIYRLINVPAAHTLELSFFQLGNRRVDTQEPQDITYPTPMTLFGLYSQLPAHYIIPYYSTID